MTTRRPLSGLMRVALPALAVCAVGCASSGGADGATATGDVARRTYFAGMKQLIDGDYVKAATLFQAVAASPQHVKHAGLAKLRLGDTLFLQGRYAEASEVYRGFIQLHPGDANLPYARFRVANCLFERIPSDWFASPPAHEFDQTITQQAEGELKGFLATFPTSIHAPEVRTMLAKTRGMLFQHELYAVDFYAERGAWQAVAWRLDTLVSGYPELTTEDAMLWRLVSAWERVGSNTDLARVLDFYLAKFPAGPHAAAARDRIEALRRAERAPERPPEAPEKPLPSDEAPEAPTSPEDEETPELRPPELPSLDPSLDP